MKNILYTLLLFIPSLIYGQQSNIIITGKTIEGGISEPMIGVTIMEKGTTNGVLSDVDGNFSLTLQSKGEAVVTVSYLGYGTAEVKVTKSEYWEIVFDEHGTHIKRTPSGAIQNQSNTLVLSSKLRNERDGDGVFYMKDDMPSSYYSEYLYSIKDIVASGEGYKIKQSKGKYYTSGYKIDYVTSLDITTIGRTPKWQSEFAQGHQGQWTEGRDLFSWGPAIADLRDEGKNVNTYLPDDFFRTGVSFSNGLNIKLPGLAVGYTDIALGQKRDNSPIPNSYKESYNVSLAMKEMKIGNFKSDIGIYYNSAYGKLTQQGSNIATLMHAVFTTPSTFDNINGVSKKNEAAWLNPDGTYRSYDPSFSDNPYALINELRDREKSEYLMGFLKTKYEYDYNKIVWENNFTYDKLWNKFHNGTLPYVLNYRIGLRKDQVANMTYNSNFKWKINNDYPQNMDVSINYDFKHNTDKIFQENMIAASGITLYGLNKGKLIRNSHNMKYGFAFDNNKVLFNIANGHYFSNTAHSGDYSNIFPEFATNVKLDEVFYDLLDWNHHSLQFYGNMKRSIGETSLVERNPSVLSTIYTAETFRNYFEYACPLYHDNLKPETYFKTELGLRYNQRYGRFSAEINGYNYNTHNLISPVIEDGFYPVLQNIGRMRSYGYFIELGYSPNMSREWHLNMNYTFSQGKTKVTALYGDKPFLRLGGFSNISTVFANNQPLGVIYGTTYLRNDAGQVVVDQDGFPIKNNELSKIGDPTPDFVMTFNPNISYRNFTLSLWLEYNHGGDRWNGTRAFMDFQGVSESSAEKRGIKQYIFNGVDQVGNINSKPVDFYDPSSGIYENRWVRYGMIGVGEEYIEKASFLRLSNITLRYSYQPRSEFVRNFSVGISAKNLFLITPYNGVDPATQMFGYSSAKGLDLFNSPSLRSYSLVVTIGF